MPCYIVSDLDVRRYGSTMEHVWPAQQLTTAGKCCADAVRTMRIRSVYADVTPSTAGITACLALLLDVRHNGSTMEHVWPAQQLTTAGKCCVDAVRTMRIRSVYTLTSPLPLQESLRGLLHCL